MEKKQRTSSQNKSLHKLFTDISNHCTAVGLDQKTVVNKLDSYESPTSPAFVKETWRAIQLAVTGKQSTIDLETHEIDEVYNVFSKFWSELTGEQFTFPSYDAMAMEALLENYK